ncbi:MAG: hypothetical protein HC939_07005 [Pleurocapsa sp. SU_5_0]|nr:hypothetical protein [Pleurocapsa sp. SU_5_0]NJO97408.1 hypothetical protein [Pleurocapsa sp. CRU_1_2]NJR46506.1 hypothetical protein [Hyellaceae cyanobacterium CSU_1_1]
MSSENIEICPVCQVQIKDDREVIFSSGQPGDRTRLWARVCQYVAGKRDGCINQNADKISAIQPTDSYQPVTFKQE